MDLIYHGFITLRRWRSILRRTATYRFAKGRTHADDLPEDGNHRTRCRHRGAQSRGRRGQGQGPGARHGPRQAVALPGGHLSTHARYPQCRCRSARRQRRLLQLRLLRGHSLGTQVGRGVPGLPRRADARAGFVEPADRARHRRHVLALRLVRQRALGRLRGRARRQEGQVPVPRSRLRSPLWHHRRLGHRERPRRDDRQRPRHGRDRAPRCRRRFHQGYLVRAQVFQPHGHHL